MYDEIKHAMAFGSFTKEKMMAAMAFDTLKIAERLEKAGYSTEQARVQVTVLAEVMAEKSEWVADHFAKKTDVFQELVGIRVDLNTFRLETKGLKTEIKSELTRLLVGMGVLQMAFVAGLILKLGG